MSLKTLNIHETKTKLSAILIEIEKTGKSVIICRNGKPVATLNPYKGNEGGRLDKHPMMSNIQIKYDPTEELTEDEWGEIG